MSGQVNTLLIEGSFDELCDELAVYFDGLLTAQSQTANIQSEIQPLLQAEKKEDVLSILVKASAVLNNAPEREILAAYNLVIHLVHQSARPDSYLAQICDNVSKPITSSPNNGVGLALGVLTTIFNTLPAQETSRYQVLEAILKIVVSHSTFETLYPQLESLDTWMSTWQIPTPQQRKLYLAVSDVAATAAEHTSGGASSQEAGVQQAYLLKALRTMQDGPDASSAEAKALSVRAIKAALSNDQTFDFQDLTALDSVQALRKSDPTWYDLLEIFSFKTLDDYTDFLAANKDFLGTAAGAGLDPAELQRKMRLLTLATLCATAASSTRTVPYATIQSALHLDTATTANTTASNTTATAAAAAAAVELWIIDVIRAGLVEGKMSQSTQTLLVHRATYRVFDERQWRVVAGRLDQWRDSLLQVLKVVRAEREGFVRDREVEVREAEAAAVAAAGFGAGGAGAGGAGAGRGWAARGGAARQGFRAAAAAATNANANATAAPAAVEVE